MRLLVTGANGGVAKAFLASVPSHHEVQAFTHGDLDIGDYHSVMQTVAPLTPNAVVNLAAMTDVDRCETERWEAYRANTLGPHNLALAARRCGAVLLHLSTDYVFDGLKGAPYDELDHPNPIAVYARSKLGGEELVRRHLPEHFIVRTAWVFGTGRDHVSRAMDRLERGESAGGVADRVGSPTYVHHLADRLLPLLLTGRFGTYHVAGPEPTTWFDVLVRLRFLAGLAVSVDRQEAAMLHLPAARPQFSALTSLFLPETDVAPMPPLDVGLKEFLDGRAR
jgi:dTDP-4-dehydrorhamnose reductase